MTESKLDAPDRDWYSAGALEPDERGREQSMRSSEHIELVSVGIDVGTATSQVVFSRIDLQRMGINLSSRFVVVARKVLYESPICFTPYTHGLRIDEAKLRSFLHEAYTAARLSPQDIDTGAIILTGEATRRENARSIADALAAGSGVFVCATAGHHMEASLAAYGSGAVARSRKDRTRLLNIDIGGGTTKFAVIDRGDIVETSALHVGGRLATFNAAYQLTRVEPMVRSVATTLGLNWEIGITVSEVEVQRVAGWMADAIVAACTEPLNTSPEILLTDRLLADRPLDGIILSGGVSEHLYHPQNDTFGDLGYYLAAALQRRAGKLPARVIGSENGIRATVLGASQHTVQVSGNTIYVSDSAALPIHNLRVLRPPVDLATQVSSDAVADCIGSHLTKFEVEAGESIVFAFKWQGQPSFRRLDAFATGIQMALVGRIASGLPLVLIFDGDVGRSVGALLGQDRKLPCAVISIDGVTLTDYEFIDIGRVSEASNTCPISIKSLLFHL